MQVAMGFEIGKWDWEWHTTTFYLIYATGCSLCIMQLVISEPNVYKHITKCMDIVCISGQKHIPGPAQAGAKPSDWYWRQDI